MDEQNLARKLLKERDKDVDIKRLLFSSKISILASIVFIILIVCSLIWHTDKSVIGFIWFMAGIMSGRFIRDYIWLKNIGKVRPLLHRFIDWSKVDAAAKRENFQSSEISTSD